MARILSTILAFAALSGIAASLPQPKQSATTSSKAPTFTTPWAAYLDRPLWDDDAPSVPLVDSPTHTLERRTGPSVTNTAAFTNGAGNMNNAQTYDGTGKAANDSYTCFKGNWTNYPPESKWLDFATMWNYNKGNMYNACSNLGIGPPDDNLTRIQQIYAGIQQVAKESLVDHRFILATVVQESLGCVYVGATNSSSGVKNPGLMQSHNGTSYNVTNSANSIVQMIRDGTQGTAYGDGLVQLINRHPNVFEAARGYNSGNLRTSDLNMAFNATGSYVNDIANRLTGWLYAERPSCPGVTA